MIRINKEKEDLICGKKIFCEHKKIFSQNCSLQPKSAELAKSSDAKMMMYRTESSETVATVCEIDAHFGQNYLNNKTKHRYQKEIKIRSKIAENQN